MSASGHGGARARAGRKPSAERKVKRSVTLSVETDAAVLAAMQPGESYSQALERLVQTVVAAQESEVTKPSRVEVLMATLGPEREPVANVYRRLGWSRQEFEGLVATHRLQLAQLGVRLYVAPKVAASGRREQYITVDGMRYSAMSRGEFPAGGQES
jgi:hypothetical protein